MADKGKGPVEQDDIYCSMISIGTPVEENLPNPSGTGQINPEPKPTLRSPIPYRVPENSPAFEDGRVILEEMENTEDGFFTKFLQINGIDRQNPEQMLAVLSHQPVAVELGMANVAPGTKKTAKQEKLCRIYLEDPKRAKRIISNRLSALRSKEKRKMHSKMMLQQKIDALKAESKALSAQLEQAQKTFGKLEAEEAQLKGQAETIQQQIKLQESLNKEMSGEIEQLRLLTGQVPANYPNSGAVIAALQLRTQTPAGTKRSGLE